jgi:hypothetical protein
LLEGESVRNQWLEVNLAGTGERDGEFVVAGLDRTI